MVKLKCRISQLDLEERWNRRAETLSLRELRTPLWNDLEKALRAADRGHDFPVKVWVEETEKWLVAQWECYEDSDVLSQEITTEAVLGHQFLIRGLEWWLEALDCIRALLVGEATPLEVLKNAEMGQRQFLTVESFHTERTKVGLLITRLFEELDECA